MAEKIKTAKPGREVGLRGKKFRHGDKIPGNLVEYFNKDALMDWEPPKMTLKKGIVKKVDDVKYKHGEEIKTEHVENIQSAFLETWTEKAAEEPGAKLDDNLSGGNEFTAA